MTSHDFWTALWLITTFGPLISVLHTILKDIREKEREERREHH
jgi:hypothetical protein